MSTKKSLLAQAKDKQKQLEEAFSLLDNLGCKVDWALDFCNYSSIDEVLSPLSYAISDAQEEIEEQLERLLEAIKSHETDSCIALKELEEYSELQYHIE